ncbi:MAG TPA: ABC transporter permease [Candidatus Dormibacteraeota bacterium]
MAAEVRLAPLWPMVAGQTQSEFRRLLRVWEFTGFGLAFPLVLYVFIGLQGSGPGAAGYHKYALASMCAYAVVNIALSTFGITVANERGSRLDALMRATPVRPIAPLIGKTVAAVAFALVALLLLYAAGILLAGISMGLEQWFNLTWRLLLAIIPFICMGFAIGYLSGPSGAVLAVNLILLPMSFASGIFFPIDSLPTFIKDIAPYLPMYHLGHLAWNAVGVPFNDIGKSVLWLTGYSVVFLAVTLWAVRREDDRRFS